MRTAVKFLSTPSARRATAVPPDVLSHLRISIHALREEGDPLLAGNLRNLHISIHALREEGDVVGRHHHARRLISIHALREEGDTHREEGRPCLSYFYPRPPRGGRLLPHLVNVLVVDISIHALREEGDISSPGVLPSAMIFLSTPSARRATFSGGGGPCRQRISIHALREEGDPSVRGWDHEPGDFYPRPPRGGRPTCRTP